MQILMSHPSISDVICLPSVMHVNFDLLAHILPGKLSSIHSFVLDTRLGQERFAPFDFVFLTSACSMTSLLKFWITHPMRIILHGNGQLQSQIFLLQSGQNRQLQIMYILITISNIVKITIRLFLYLLMVLNPHRRFLLLELLW